MRVTINKKFLIIVLIVVMAIVGVIIWKNSKKVENTQPSSPVAEEPKEPEYVDENPVVMGVYLEKDNNRTLVKEFESKWPKKKDIVSFKVFFTNEETVKSGYVQTVFYDYYNEYENPSQYHIGYHLKFTTDEGKTLEKTILSPKDSEALYDYIETYMYNSAQKKIGQWYSHVTEEEYNDSTILSSIKLTAGSLIDKITSDIELTAFTYDGMDDFDENGNYRGKSSQKVIVKNMNK